jgi:FlaA1/EpsC-like NDP-sugar epimerase
MGVETKQPFLNLLKTTKLKRRAFFLLADAVILIGAAYFAFWVRFDGHIAPQFIAQFRYLLIPKIAIYIFFLAIFGLYSFTWRFFGLRDLGRLVAASVLSAGSLLVLIYVIDPNQIFQGFPRSVALVDFIVTICFLGALRTFKRGWIVLRQRTGKFRRGATRLLIIGAGAAGTQICKEMLGNPSSHCLPVGFIDDDPAKLGMYIERVKVVGMTEDLPDILEANGIDEVLVAMPSATSSQIRHIVEVVRSAHRSRKIKILPSLLGLVDGNVEFSDIKEIQLEDVLGRDPVKIEFDEIRAMISGKSVLVTGAGGSIGSELARTVLQFGPSKLALLDIDETELFHLMHRFEDTRVPITPVIADVRDRVRIASVFSAHEPDIVLHAAAYKHVPILEHYPEEAIKTNIKGTMILAEEAIKAKVGVFVNISTDKAINPTSVMGATKRAAEEILRLFNAQCITKFVSVRFGNVIGSRGSVVPLFQEQICKGGPVTVTHPEMKRYFMAVSEAVLLVLEAAAGGAGGETFVLDMGIPIKIADLAREMISLSGKQPDVDIPIVYTGLRPGEKLFEEVLGGKEETGKTRFEKIFVAKRVDLFDKNEIMSTVAGLIEASENGGGIERLKTTLSKIVPTYHPDVNGHSNGKW